jgi:hypothetical protein
MVSRLSELRPTSAVLWGQASGAASPAVGAPAREAGLKSGSGKEIAAKQG